MNTQRKVVILATSVLILAGAFVITDLLAGRDGGQRFRLEGVWIGKNSWGNMHTTNFVGENPSNKRVSFVADIFQGSGLADYFPDVAIDQDLPGKGEAIRTGPRTFDARFIMYGLNADNYPVWILTVDMVIELIDPNTYVGAGTVDVYSAREQVSPVLGELPDQDADNDGLPDPDAEPVLPGLPFDEVVKRLVPASVWHGDDDA